MTLLSKFAKFLLIGCTTFALVACQTTNKTAETVEESTDNFEYIQAEKQAEQERLQQELEQAKQEQDRLQAEADKAREAEALAEEKASEEAEARAQAEADAQKAKAEAAKAKEEAAKAKEEGSVGVVNENVPVGMPTDSVYFDFDKSFIVPKFDDVLNAHAKYLKANPDLNVEIQGNCDERGSREYNIGLGNRRALAVKAGLEILGIQSGRITITSFGSEKPLALGHDETSWQQNRRADFVY
ncbi:MAG: peptidoglycan-associated lipoprotein Pal [Burkholderiales bacterium]|nr:peptidoglycan-associated lipoprotein Pal [Burkholderiales bacterium]